MKKNILILFLSVYYILPLFCLGNNISIDYKNLTIEQIDSIENEIIKRGQFEDALNYCDYIISNSNNKEILLAQYKKKAYLKSRLGKYDDAINWGERILSEIGKENETQTIEYAEALDALAKYYSRASQYDKAKELQEKAIDIILKVDGKNTKYVGFINNLSHYWFKIGDFLKAQTLANEADSIINSKEPDSSLHTDILRNLARYKSRLGNYEEAIKLNEHAIDLLKNIKGEDHPDYANLLSDLSTYYSRLGKYDEAIDKENQALDIRNRNYGSNHPDYATSLSHLAHYYYKLGNFSNAIILGKRSVKTREVFVTESHSDYIESLNDLSKYYAASDSLELAIETSEKVLKLKRSKKDYENSDYANSLSNLAYFYSLKRNYDKSLEYENTVLAIRKLNLGETHPDVGKSLYRISYYYKKSGQLDSAYSYGIKALDLQETRLGNLHPDVINTMMQMAEICLKSGIYEEGRFYISKATSYNINRIKNGFLSLTNEERKKLWDNSKEWFEIYLPSFVLMLPDDIEIRESAYNGILFSKGILLNSEQEFGNFLLVQNNPGLIEKYKNIINIRKEIEKVYEKPKKDFQNSLDSLERILAINEKDLIKECKEYGDYTANLSLNWKEIRHRLKENDVAIEFVKVKKENGSVSYVAYVLKQNSEYPEIIPLCDEKSLFKLAGNFLVKDSEKISVSKLIWGKLEPELKSFENVYFAPDGVLHQIPIENLPDYDNKEATISKRYNLYRVSSTRQLTKDQNFSSSLNSLVMGGIEYGAKPDKIKYKTSSYNGSITKKERFRRGVIDRYWDRSGLNSLPFTLIEAELIDERLNRMGYKDQLVTGKDATEENFKKLSSQESSILHIATHGFYWNAEEADKRAKLDESFLFMSQTGENAPNSDEEKALNRTGLFLAGANNILTGQNIPEEMEDGILTASEISKLDLNKLDLVVLSACQTGLGDINGDGVFGLQRGFKKAGANSILMSLWKVDDAATQMLMTSFYENLLNGMSKQKSLIEAQEKVKNYKGYLEGIKVDFAPYKYWAGFILLDGLD